MRGIKLVPNAVALGFGAVDGAVKNWDLAQGRSSPVGQWSLLLEAAGLLVGAATKVTGWSERYEDGGLLYAAEGLLAQRLGMWAGQKMTGQGPGRQISNAPSAAVDPSLGISPTLPVMVPYAGAAGGGGRRFAGPAVGRGWRDGRQGSAVYPARREPAGILG